MRENLTQYVNLLFAGNPDAEEIRDEILQNTLDRFDDLVAQGKSPEAAYSLAISGIGDISELVGNHASTAPQSPLQHAETAPDAQPDPSKVRLMHAVAIAMYICCIIPVIALGAVGYEILGLVLMFLMIAAATALLILSGNEEKKKSQDKTAEPPKSELEKTLGTITLVIYLAVSFLSGAWHITWLIFPISGAVKGLIRAIRDLKEAR